MRYCALMGSTKSFTPAFSTQKSPSSIFSSKVKPYWKPEHPPPETNTLSLRFGLASSRINSPTLPAAASVKTSTFGGGGTISVPDSDSCDALIWLFYASEAWPIKIPDSVRDRLHCWQAPESPRRLPDRRRRPANSTYGSVSH